MTSAKLKILICDDYPQAASEWAHQIRGRVGGRADILNPQPAEIREALAHLASRQRAARESTIDCWHDVSIFDDADIAFLDYDLLDVGDANHITGNELAYLVRCYSTCKLIVVLNEADRGGPTFDLQLESPIDHFADLRISSQHVGNPGLWSGDFIGFRPWSWPILEDEISAFESRVEVVQTRLNDPVFAVIGLEKFVDRLSRDAIAALETRDREAKEVTLRDSVNPASGLGIRSKDVLPKWQIPRVAAARITHWLKRLVLPAQDPLVDAPHLISRFPSLVGSATDLGLLQRINRLAFDLSALGLDDTPVANLMVNLYPWIDRPHWFWPQVQENTDLPEINDPWSRPPSRIAFLEDLSRFVELDLAMAYSSQVSSMNDLRFVFSSEHSEARRLIAEEQNRAEEFGVDWNSCNPVLVARKPASWLAE